jgi:hypothetical protein
MNTNNVNELREWLGKKVSKTKVEAIVRVTLNMSEDEFAAGVLFGTVMTCAQYGRNLSKKDCAKIEASAHAAWAKRHESY